VNLAAALEIIKFPQDYPRAELIEAARFVAEDYVEVKAELARMKRVPLFCRACATRLIDGICGRCGA